MSTKQTTIAQECSDFIEQYFKDKPFERFTLDDFHSETGLLAEETISVPQNPSKTNTQIPSLLLYDLQDDDHKTKDVYRFIDESRGFCSGLYGTSGAGKTRSIYEYLSHNFGLYFLAGAGNDPGSVDLSYVVDRFGTAHSALGDESFQFDHDLQSQDPEEEKKRLRHARLVKSESNYIFMKKYMMIMIYIRVVIFDSINKQLAAKKQHSLTPYDWLLIQLFPKQALKCDLFGKVCIQALIWERNAPWTQMSCTTCP